MKTRHPILGLLALGLLMACQASPTQEIPMPTAIVQLQPTRTSTLFSSTAEAAMPTPRILPQARAEPTTYIVQGGDTLSRIATDFGLQPETVLWANYGELLDNPDALLPGMHLLILPVDGLYHQVGGGDTITGIANFFATDPQAIIDWPGNGIDSQNPIIFTGQWLVVPDGQRLSRRRTMPNISRNSAALDYEEFGSGACEGDFPVGPVGDAVYAWPVSQTELRGESYDEWHPGLDIAVNIGEPVRAADDGVVVFSGWSNLGYGYMVMIDHGNGDTSLYSGLGGVVAVCSQPVTEGDVVGEAGLTGYPAGPILHFEIRRRTEFLNPVELIPGAD